MTVEKKVKQMINKTRMVLVVTKCKVLKFGNYRFTLGSSGLFR